jgi:patatin-like phospholipase/acyl hydrolase
MYKVLSLDGGGVRGVLTARILDRLGQARPNLLAGADLLAGTSAGAINAAGLAAGKAPSDLVQLYQTYGPRIFSDSLFHEIGHLWGIGRAKYGNEGRKQALQSLVGGQRLSDLGKRVLLTTFELDSHNPNAPANPGTPRTWKAKLFHNFPKDNDGTPNQDLSQSVLDVVMRSSAAPTYFPIYQGFIDGGIVANNPSMCALAQALNANTGAHQVQDVVVLSVGTGKRSGRYITSMDGDWGLSQWNLTLVELAVDSFVGDAEYECRQLIDRGYRRINPEIKDVALDAADQVGYLIGAADAWAGDGTQFRPALDWIDQYWR